MSYKSPGPYGSGPRLLNPDQRLRLFGEDEPLPDDLQCSEPSPRQPGFDLGSPCGYSVGPLLSQTKFLIVFEVRYREWAADKAEFELLNAYGVGRNFPGIGYRAFTNLDDYLRHRATYFGSREEYLQYAAESDQELSAASDEVRKLVLKPKDVGPPWGKKPDGTEPTSAEQQTAQAIFYRWLRKAYQRKFKVGNVADDLRERRENYLQLEAEVKEKVIKDLKPAFVPRPERVAAEGGKLRFILGTISDHTRGVAVDLDWNRNPDVAPAEWNFIMGYVGMTFACDLGRWTNDPEGLFRDIKAMSDRFREKIKAQADLVALYQSVMNEQSEARSMPSVFPIPFSHGALASKAGYLLHKIRSEGKDPSPGKKDIDKYVQCAGSKFLDSQPVDVVLDTALSDCKGMKPDKAALQKLVPGFFTLEAKVVKAFRDFGFTWGVTFPQPDLMHFTLDGKTPPRNVKGDFVSPNATTG